MMDICQLYYTSCIMFHLPIASRIQNKMAWMKQTPRNPHVSQPKAAIGSDVQPQRRSTFKPTLSRTPVKGEKAAQEASFMEVTMIGHYP